MIAMVASLFLGIALLLFDAPQQELSSELKALGLSPGDYKVTARMLADGAIHQGTGTGAATVSVELKASALMIKVAYTWPDGATAENIFIVSFDYVREEYVLTSFVAPSSMVRSYRGKIGSLLSESTIPTRYSVVRTNSESVVLLLELMGSAGDWQKSTELTFTKRPRVTPNE